MTVLLLLACAHPPTPAPVAAPPVEGAWLTWFDLEGTDRIDLLESCLERCPRDEAGVTVASLTTWRLDWSWTPRPTDTCEVAGANVDVAVTVELPRWAPPSEADPALVVEWGQWLTALERHEQGHVEVAHVFAHDAEAVIADAGCAGADAAGTRLLAGLRQAQVDYDAETASGHTQGASFWRIGGRSVGSATP
ncbi:MAG: DUF922 domain-containing protein [Pseudomonadota bacterium]|nr:DUF922 domain-containing protein [Pseudomonadota bacterium]